MNKEYKETKKYKIRIYYFSATGNTKYGILHLQKYLTGAGHTCELLSVESESSVRKDDYDILGFASPVYGGYPAEIMMKFIKQSPYCSDKIPAFTVLCPCSNIGYWGSREIFANALLAKNIKVITELGFLGNPSHPIVVGSMEEASPKLRSFFNGIGRPDSYDEKKIHDFSEELIRIYQHYCVGKKFKKLRHSSIKVWVSNKMRTKEMNVGKSNPITLNQEKCIQCGLCEKACPTKALTLNPYPVRDMSKCFHCQKCTNLCPKHAFYLKDLECIGYYKGAFDKIKKMNHEDKSVAANEIVIRHKEPLLLKFLSTSIGMVILMIINKYTDKKVIRNKRKA